MEKVFLNNRLLLKKDASISPFDRGFLFGDAVYEVIPVYDERPFAMDFHYKRMVKNLNAIQIPVPFEYDDFNSIVLSLINQEHKPQQYAVYMQITRGDSGCRRHIEKANLPPTIFAFLQERSQITKADYQHGFKAILQEDIRWQKSGIKTTSLLANIISLQSAYSQSAQEVLMHRDGKITEGTSSNVLFGIKGRLITPALDEKIIPGTTRYRVITAARGLGIDVQECDCPLGMLDIVDEIIFTGGTKELMPIVRLDNKIIGNGKPGLLWNKLFDVYQDMVLQSAETLA